MIAGIHSLDERVCQMNGENFRWIIGEVRSEVILELICEPGISRPRMYPVTDFPKTTRVEVSRKLREISAWDAF
jgi:hypothetical protein